MNHINIILIIFVILFTLLFYLHFRKKESFEGIAGSSFVSRVPKGTIVAFNGTTAPAGWALCDGKDGKTPDLRGRFIRMASDGLNEMGNEPGFAFANVKVSNEKTKIFSGVAKSNSESTVIGLYKFGEQGGSDKIKLDEQDQLPAHTHGNIPKPADNCFRGGDCSGDRTHVSGVQESGSTGSSEYIPNVPPFYTLVFIMKL